MLLWADELLPSTDDITWSVYDSRLFNARHFNINLYILFACGESFLRLSRYSSCTNLTFYSYLLSRRKSE